MDARKRTLILVAKQLCYALLLFAAYVLQTTPGFLTFFGVKPVLLVPTAICIAVLEGVFPGALWGAAAGLLWDIASGRTGGFFAIQLMALCFCCAALVALYLRDTPLNLSLLTGAVMLLVCSSDFLFSYLLHGYSGLGWMYLRRVLPVVLLSAAVTAVPRWLTRRIAARFVYEE